jgi:hypothetical protein
VPPGLAGQRPASAASDKPHHDSDLKRSSDLVGLYLNPPDKALVLCCDEKSQCQALERTQPGLPVDFGHIRTKTQD